jgi:hypothetical protein
MAHDKNKLPSIYGAILVWKLYHFISVRLYGCKVSLYFYRVIVKNLGIWTVYGQFSVETFRTTSLHV